MLILFLKYNCIIEMQLKKSVGRLERFKAVLAREKHRYSRLGYGKYWAITQLYMLFIILPEILTMIWPYLLQNYSHMIIYVVGILLTNILVFIPYNLVMIFIYRSKNSFFEAYRINKKLWPWEQNYQEWKKTLRKTLISVSFNVLFFGQLLMLFDTQVNFFIKFEMDQIPGTSTIIVQFLFFFLVEDITFYITHSTLHSPKLYWIHKKHHQYSNTISLAAEYAHPLQYMFGNAIPFGLGYKLLSKIYPVHIITIFVWGVYRIIQTCDGHCGYDWTWSISQLIPFGAGSDYHNFHHSRNSGNYGSMLMFWDTFWGTNTEYNNFKEEKQGQTIKND